MSNLLNSISDPSDLRKLNPEQLPQLAKELREFIIDIVATKEGHLGASLGVVELTIALHYLFDTPDDLLVWDVGHQAYGHKILTGRRDEFISNRKYNGLSGFPKRSESELPPRRLEPCIPPATSPAANNPGTPTAAAVSGSTSTPPIT